MNEAVGIIDGDAEFRPRATAGHAPDVFSHDGFIPMRCYRDEDEVDVVVIGTGAGGGTLARRLAEAGIGVVAFDAGPFFRPLSDFASDEREQEKIYWRDPRISGGDDPIQFGANNSGRGVGGSTVHFQMVSLRWRPEWFAARTKLGYGVDWPVDWRTMWSYYDRIERLHAISGPVHYPWGPPRGPYPYRAHEVNAAGQVLARGAEAMGVEWAPTPLCTVSAPRGKSPPCVYRGMCKIGCSTNAKQSVLITHIPAAIAAGAEIRDLAMVGRIETDRNGRATGVHYYRDGKWRFQKAKTVVVSGYSIETPRLLLNSHTAQHPQGLANSSGLVGRYLMVHANHAAWGTFDDEIRWYKGPPSMAVCEHWNYVDNDPSKDFDGGYSFMSQGPLPADFAATLASNFGLFGQDLSERMKNYNRMAGLKIVGDTMPNADNRVSLDTETDQFGLPRPRVDFSFGDNDKRLQNHALAYMSEMLKAAGGSDIFQTSGSAHLMGGCRMGDDPHTSVVNADGRSWDVPNLFVCDGSLLPMAGGVNPWLTIAANALRIGDRMVELAAEGTLG